MVLITIAVAMYKKHHDAEKKNEEIKELALDGNSTLPDQVPAIPADTEAGQHWRLGVDPAAKGAVRRNSSVRSTSTARSSGDGDSHYSTDQNVDELWDEVASMVECPTPRQGDYFDERDVLPRKVTGLRRGSRYTSGTTGLQRSQTGRMSIMSAASTDSWTSRYSCMTDGRRYDDDDDGRSVKFF